MLGLAFFSPISPFAFLKAAAVRAAPSGFAPCLASLSKLGVLAALLAPSTSLSLFVSSIKPPRQALPVLCVKDVNPHSARGVPFALPHRDLKAFAAEGFSSELQGSCCCLLGLWGAGQSCGRALALALVAARGWDFAPLPSWRPLHPGVSLPPPCRADATGNGAAVGAGQRHSKDALPHMGHPGEGQRGDLPAVPGTALAHAGVQPVGLTPLYADPVHPAQPHSMTWSCLLGITPYLGTCSTPVAAPTPGPVAGGRDGQAVMLMRESKAPCGALSLPCARQLARACSSQQSMAAGSEAYEEPQRCLLHLTFPRALEEAAGCQRCHLARW